MAKRLRKPSEATRAYLYRVATAGGLTAVGFGVLTEAKAFLIVGLVGTILGNGLASVNTSTKARK